MTGSARSGVCHFAKLVEGLVLLPHSVEGFGEARIVGQPVESGAFAAFPPGVRFATRVRLLRRVLVQRNGVSPMLLQCRVDFHRLGGSLEGVDAREKRFVVSCGFVIFVDRIRILRHRGSVVGGVDGLARTEGTPLLGPDY